MRASLVYKFLAAKLKLNIKEVFFGNFSQFINLLLLDAEYVLRRPFIGFYLSTLIVSASISSWIFKIFSFRQSYSQLIVGSIAWDNGNKTNDYLMLVTFVITSLSISLMLSRLLLKIRNRYGFLGLKQYDNYNILLSTPASFWFFSLLVTKNQSLFLLFFSASLLIVSNVFAFILIWKKEGFWENCDVSEFINRIKEIHIFFIILFLSITSVSVLFFKAKIFLGLSFYLSPKLILVTTLIVALISMALLVWYGLSAKLAKRMSFKIRNIIWHLQFLAPLLFLLLIPNGFISEGRVVGLSYPSYALILLIIAISLYALKDIFSCGKKALYDYHESSNLVSWLVIVAAIFLFKTPFSPPPILSPDDYHFGEKLTAWWGWSNFKLIPFWDYDPARGLMNYIQGALASFFFDGSVSSIGSAASILYLVILLIGFPVISSSIGKLKTCLVFLIAPYLNDLSEIDLIVTIFICYFCYSYSFSRNINWLLKFVFFSFILLIYAPGQAGLVLIAFSPLVLVALLDFIKEYRKLDLVVMSIFFISFVLLCIFSPLGLILFGAIRYGIEQSSVNSIANGVVWSKSFNTSFINPWLFEITRSLWIFICVYAGLVLIGALKAKKRSDSKVLLIYTIPIFLVTFLFIIRAACRIDPAGASRLGIASVWAVSLLLPILFFVTKKNKIEGLLIFVWISLSGLIAPYFSNTEIKVNDFYRAIFSNVYIEKSDFINMEKVNHNFPSVGYMLPDKTHFDRLIKTKNILDDVLDVNETYLDLTNRGANYFYFNRKPIIETAAVYNLITEQQQLRSLNKLRLLNPAAILVYSDNITHDGGALSLRCYLLYRYLMLLKNYSVVEIGDQVWVIRNDRLPRLKMLDVRSISRVEDDSHELLNKHLRTYDLLDIPFSWGSSYENLKKNLNVTYKNNIQNNLILETNSVAISSNKYVVTGRDPFLRFNLESLNITGAKAGLVSFDFQCEEHGHDIPKIKVYWASDVLEESESRSIIFNGQNGKLLVPMDTIPAWILSNKLQSIRFDIDGETSCRSFSLKNLQFLQRKVVVN